MIRQTVETSNIIRLMALSADLMREGSPNERMAMVFGRPGEGKTTAIEHLAIQTGAVYVRAVRSMSPTALLQAICTEVGVRPGRQRYAMYTAIVEALKMETRLICIDEADYCADREDLLDTLRDIYDGAGSPVVLFGMETLPGLIPAFAPDRPLTGRHARFTRRITRRLEFGGITLLDAQRVAGDLCEVDVEGALQTGQAAGSVDARGTLVDHLFREAQGNVGRLVVLLEEAERAAVSNRLGEATLDMWTALASARSGR